MVNIKKLKGVMAGKECSVGLLAKRVGKSRSTIYRWFQNDGENITIADADAISKALNLTGQEASIIFFNQYVA